MAFGLLENSQDLRPLKRIAVLDVINLFLWQLLTLLHGEMVKKTYEGIGITSVGISESNVDQKTFKIATKVRTMILPMAQPIRPSTVLPAVRTVFNVTTKDGVLLI